MRRTGWMGATAIAWQFVAALLGLLAGCAAAVTRALFGDDPPTATEAAGLAGAADCRLRVVGLQDDGGPAAGDKMLRRADAHTEPAARAGLGACPGKAVMRRSGYREVAARSRAVDVPRG